MTALGIVYGDIGTSPLYVHRAIARITGGHFDQISALGSLSLIFWTLIIVVTIKYALIVMRADNRGEGGILALMSVTRASWHGRKPLSNHIWPAWGGASLWRRHHYASDHFPFLIRRSIHAICVVRPK